MNQVTVSRGAGRPRIAIAAFAAYAALSGSWGMVGHPDLAALMYGQALVYLVVATALWRRSVWGPWLAIGTALSGLAIDLAVVSACDVASPFWLDLLMQAALLLAALRLGRRESVQKGGIGEVAAAPVGWTFALAVGAFLALWLAVLAPPPGGCLFGPVPAPWLESAWLTAMPVLAAFSVLLIARMRTAGLVLLMGAAVLGTLVLMERLGGHDGVYEYWELKLDVFLAAIGHAFLIAACIPLGPKVLRLLVTGRSA